MFRPCSSSLLATVSNLAVGCNIAFGRMESVVARHSAPGSRGVASRGTRPPDGMAHLSGYPVRPVLTVARYSASAVVRNSRRSSADPTIGREPRSGTCALSGRNFTVTSPISPAAMR